MMWVMWFLLYLTRMLQDLKIYWASTTVTPVLWSLMARKFLKFKILSPRKKKMFLLSGLTLQKTAETRPKSKSFSQHTKRQTWKITCMVNSWRLATSAVTKDWGQSLCHRLRIILRLRNTLKSTSQTHSGQHQDYQEILCLQSQWNKHTPTGTWRVRAGVRWDGMTVWNLKTFTINLELIIFKFNFYWFYIMRMRMKMKVNRKNKNHDLC